MNGSTKSYLDPLDLFRFKNKVKIKVFCHTWLYMEHGLKCKMWFWFVIWNLKLSTKMKMTFENTKVEVKNQIIIIFLLILKKIEINVDSSKTVKFIQTRMYNENRRCT